MALCASSTTEFSSHGSSTLRVKLIESGQKDETGRSKGPRGSLKREWTCEARSSAPHGKAVAAIGGSVIIVDTLPEDPFPAERERHTTSPTLSAMLLEIYNADGDPEPLQYYGSLA